MSPEDRMGRAEDRLASLERLLSTVSENSRFLLHKSTEEDLEELKARVVFLENLRLVDIIARLEVRIAQMERRLSEQELHMLVFQKQSLENRGRLQQIEDGGQKTESATTPICGTTDDGEVHPLETPFDDTTGAKYHYQTPDHGGGSTNASPAQQLADYAEKFTTPDICPTCGHKRPMTGAERQKAYRDRK